MIVNKTSFFNSTLVNANSDHVLQSVFQKLIFQFHLLKTLISIKIVKIDFETFPRFIFVDNS